MGREIAKTELKEYPPDQQGGLTRETVTEFADGSINRAGGIETGPDQGRRWNKWDEKEPRPIPGAPSKAELWDTGSPSRIEALRAQRYGFITAASENETGPSANDAWLHAEADVEELPADPFSADDLALVEKLSKDNSVIEVEYNGVKTTFRRDERGDQVTIQIVRVLEDGTELMRGEHISGEQKGAGWISREAPADKRMPSDLRLTTDDGSIIGGLHLKKSTFTFGPETQRRMYVEYVGRRESKSDA